MDFGKYMKSDAMSGDAVWLKIVMVPGLLIKYLSVTGIIKTMDSCDWNRSEENKRRIVPGRLMHF